jgi:hypothetical protein
VLDAIDAKAADLPARERAATAAAPTATKPAWRTSVTTLIATRLFVSIICHVCLTLQYVQ